MEEAYDALKELILKDVNARLPGFETEGVELPPLSGRAVCFGVVDPLKAAGETLCAIWPEEAALEDGYITGEGRASLSVTVSFYCRGALYEELMLRADRYAKCFLSCLGGNPSLGGKARDVRPTRVAYYPDCGTVERQAAGAEIELTLYMEDSLWRQQS